MFTASTIQPLRQLALEPQVSCSYYYIKGTRAKFHDSNRIGILAVIIFGHP